MKKATNAVWVVLMTVFCFPLVVSAQLSIPQKIHVQALVRGNDGSPTSMSYLDADVSLWTDAVSGDSVWSDEIDIEIVEGMTNVVLEISSNIFAENQSLWLEIALNDDLIVARRQFVSVPYAYAAEEAKNCATLDNQLPGYYMPPGGIIMWSGSIASIPDGWGLCNGLNDTPDLRNRFIVGAGSSYEVDVTGGENSVTLTESRMPAHTHGPGTYSGNIDAHYGGDASGGDTNVVTMIWETVTNTPPGVSINGGESGETGGGLSHENRPPYYALAYIMKL